MSITKGARRRADALALLAQLVGDRGGDQFVLGSEVRVEGAHGQAGVRHQPGDPGTIDPVALEPATSGLDDPLPGRPLVLLAVPHHWLLSARSGGCSPRAPSLQSTIISSITKEHLPPSLPAGIQAPVTHGTNAVDG